MKFDFKLLSPVQVRKKTHVAHTAQNKLNISEKNPHKNQKPKHLKHQILIPCD